MADSPHRSETVPSDQTPALDPSAVDASMGDGNATSIAAAVDRLTAELRLNRLAGGHVLTGLTAQTPPEPDGRTTEVPATIIAQPKPDPLAPRPTNRSARRPGPIAIVLSLLLVLLGQRSLASETSFLHFSPETEERLRPTWQNPESVIAALILFALAITVLLLSMIFRGRQFPGLAVLYRFLDKTSVALVGSGLMVFSWVILTLKGDAYSPWLPRLYLLALALILAGLVRRDRKILRALLPEHITRWHLLEFGAVLGLIGIFLFLAMRDIRNWQYASIGDEHAFFDVALWFSDGRGPQNLFTNEGVYGYHPMLSSYFVSQVMRVAGNDVFGWKLGYNVLAAIGLGFYYGLARTMFNRTTALVALGLIVSSHYLLAFAHIGYNNLEPILSTCAALLFFVLATRRSSTTLYVLSGLFAGLGWYTFYSGRITIGLLAVCTLLVVQKRHWIRSGLWIAFGFVLGVLPLVVVSGHQIYERMRIETVATPEGPPRSDLSRLLINSGRSLIVFNYSTVRAHNVSGALLEPVTATFFAFGVLFALVTIRNWRSRMLLAWFLIGIVATGVLSKYDFAPITRMHYVLPCAVLIAAAAACQAVSAATFSLSPRVRRFAIPVALAIIVGASTFLDLRRFYVTTPALAGSSQTAVIWRAMTTDSCQTLGMDPILLARDGDGFLDWVVKEQQPDFSIVHITYTDPVDWIETAQQRCIIVRDQNDPEAQALIAQVQERWPAIVSTSVTNRANGGEVLVLAPREITLDD